MTNIVDPPGTVPTTAGTDGGGPAGTDLVAFLCGAWQELLGASGDVPDSDFFALGGHSFLAIEVITRLQTSFDLEVPFWWIFECPTPRLLAERIAQMENQP